MDRYREIDIIEGKLLSIFCNAFWFKSFSIWMTFCSCGNTFCLEKKEKLKEKFEQKFEQKIEK